MEDISCESVENISRMQKRSFTGGIFGIWGYDIEDLIYNGESTIKIFESDESVVCCFNVSCI
jgi:hypothetical protein